MQFLIINRISYYHKHAGHKILYTVMLFFPIRKPEHKRIKEYNEDASTCIVLDEAQEIVTIKFKFT
jgi:hypothetical protein